MVYSRVRLIICQWLTMPNGTYILDNNRGKSVGKDKSLILYSLLVFCHSLDKHPNSLFICVFLVPFPSFSAGREAVTAAGEMIGVAKCLRFSVSFDLDLPSI